MVTGTNGQTVFTALLILDLNTNSMRGYNLWVIESKIPGSLQVMIVLSEEKL